MNKGGATSAQASVSKSDEYFAPGPTSFAPPPAVVIGSEDSDLDSIPSDEISLPSLSDVSDGGLSDPADDFSPAKPPPSTAKDTVRKVFAASGGGLWNSDQKIT